MHQLVSIADSFICMQIQEGEQAKTGGKRRMVIGRVTARQL